MVPFWWDFGRPGGVWAPLGASWGRLGVVLGRLEASWSVLGRPGGVLAPPWPSKTPQHKPDLTRNGKRGSFMRLSLARTIQNIFQNLPNFIPKPSKIHPKSFPNSLPKRILRGSALWQPTMNFNEFLLSLDPLGLPLGPKLAPSCGHLGRPGGILAALGRSWAATWPPGTPQKPR